jgi:hypothetical protein
MIYYQFQIIVSKVLMYNLLKAIFNLLIGILLMLEIVVIMLIIHLQQLKLI